MHQSFETPAPPPPPIQALVGDWGAFISDTLHVVSPVGGEFAGSHDLRMPYRGNKRGSHCTSTLFVLKRLNCSHFAERINHYYK